jgi:hypothetical protein
LEALRSCTSGLDLEVVVGIDHPSDAHLFAKWVVNASSTHAFRVNLLFGNDLHEVSNNSLR